MRGVDDEEEKIDPLRTAVAAKGVELSALFFVVFEHHELPGKPRRQPRLVAPPGPSTAGGKQSRQNITLAPIDGETGPPVVAGWADSSTHRAELRSHRLIAEAFRTRRGRTLDIPASAYRKFIREAEDFLREQGFVIVELDHVTSAQPQSGLTVGTWILILLAVLVLGIGIGIGWMLGS